MWSNLLSGAIGSVLGIIGAVAVAVFTVRRADKQQDDAAASVHNYAMRRAAKQRAYNAAGQMAVPVVATFDELKRLANQEAEPSAGDFTTLRELVDELRRSIVLHGSIVPVDLEQRLKDTRKTIAQGIPPVATPPTREEVKLLLAMVDATGDGLRELREEGRGN